MGRQRKQKEKGAKIPLLKRTFKGETLESYVEAAKCRTLEEFK